MCRALPNVVGMYVILITLGEPLALRATILGAPSKDKYIRKNGKNVTLYNEYKCYFKRR